jgi:protein-disulfide isomerase
MNKNNSLIFAITILISGIVIGGGVFLSRTEILDNIFDKLKKEEVIEIQESQIQPISDEDHIIGNPDASIIIIEYSDFECPYCKEFHTTMRRIIDNYGQNGNVAWVYRHAPLEEVHVNSKRVSLVSECVAKIGGENKFWNFTNQIFDNAPDSLLKTNTDLILESLNLDPIEINTCTEEPEIINLVNSDSEDVKYLRSIDSDFGTPYNIIITKTGVQENIPEAIPYKLLSDFIEQHTLNFN